MHKLRLLPFAIRPFKRKINSTYIMCLMTANRLTVGFHRRNEYRRRMTVVRRSWGRVWIPSRTGIWQPSFGCRLCRWAKALGIQIATSGKVRLLRSLFRCPTCPHAVGVAATPVGRGWHLPDKTVSFLYMRLGLKPRKRCEIVPQALIQLVLLGSELRWRGICCIFCDAGNGILLKAKTLAISLQTGAQYVLQTRFPRYLRSICNRCSRFGACCATDA